MEKKAVDDSDGGRSNSMDRRVCTTRCINYSALNTHMERGGGESFGEDVLVPNRNLNTGGGDKYIYKCN